MVTHPDAVTVIVILTLVDVVSLTPVMMNIAVGNWPKTVQDISMAAQTVPSSVVNLE